VALPEVCESEGRTLSHDVPSPIAETLAILLLVATLGCAVVRPRGFPAFAALAGAVTLAVPALGDRRTTVRDLVLAVDIPFLAFVLALGLIVKAISIHGLGSLVAHLVPGGTSLVALLVIAIVAAVLANLINNLPAVLLLLPAVAGAGPGPVLAVLIGVKTGPNLAYVGSLATLLWRRVIRQRGADLPISEFLRLGAITVPPVLLVSTLALWLALRLVG
jgi:arsenical pump membrane protein